MKAGKIILGFDALRVILNTAVRQTHLAQDLTAITMKAMAEQQDKLQEACGFAYRTRYVEDLPVQMEPGTQYVDGFLFEIRVGPNPVVDNPEKYDVVRYLARLDSDGQFLALYHLPVPPELGDDDAHQGFYPEDPRANAGRAAVRHGAERH